ncbi:MAG: hypothetical protein MUO76_07045 [Anaerolineaceae bacterium]|nr:hypothetical protein [Anaerolineaceae bacterium]
MKKVLVSTLLAILLLSFAACAAGPNELAATENSEGELAGFWRGLWHGFIAPFTFLVSLFNENVGIYELHNNGGWYNFGFMFGVTIILGGGGGGSRRVYSRRRNAEGL